MSVRIDNTFRSDNNTVQASDVLLPGWQVHSALDSARDEGRDPVAGLG